VRPGSTEPNTEMADIHPCGILTRDPSVPVYVQATYILVPLKCHVTWFPCHHNMERPLVADGGDGLQIWKVPTNILNKQSRTADKR